MFSAVPISKNQVAYDRETFENHLKKHFGKLDLTLLTPNLHHPLVIPFIAYAYNFCIRYYRQVNISILYREEQVEQKPNYEIVNLEPFEHHDAVETVCFGGSFDRLHYGHKLLITAGVILCNKYLIIGVNRATSKKSHHELIEPFEDRASSCLNFVFKLNQDLIVRIEVIDDVAGPTGYLPNIDLLVLSQETIKGGDMVNEIRKQKGLQPIAYAPIPLITLMTGSRLSSSYLRELASSNAENE
ncbi:hypothetical protein M9Y10_034484 [Tritrichomonas musculus]|uniref:Cytidyltransferase-like domain-containing protein n=1 Tax=Tritrichomonas musculus TaxID=1915356 RepID=A0ABR2KI86_9EUKA